jgi:hypothetical protein
VVTPRLPRYIVGAFALCCLSATVFAGCGSSTSNSSNSSTNTTSPSPATATACALLRTNFRPATGTIQSVSGQTVHIKENSGGTVDATFSSSTRISQQTLAATSALQTGANVMVQVQPNSNGSYTATSITLTPAGQFGQFGQGANGNRTGGNRSNGMGQACFGGRRGTGNGAGQTNVRRVVGTIGQVNGTTSITITDRQQNNYTIMLSPSTKVIQNSSATSSALQAGIGISVTGKNNNGVITATSMNIYSPGLMPTATPTNP